MGAERYNIESCHQLMSAISVYLEWTIEADDNYLLRLWTILSALIDELARQPVTSSEDGWRRERSNVRMGGGGLVPVMRDDMQIGRVVDI